MNTTYKAQASQRELVDLLKKWLFATMPVATDSFDSDGNPVTTFSEDASPTDGEKVIVIRTKAIGNPDATDILGNTANQYSHHVIQLCTEANEEGTTDNVDDILTPFELLPVIAECSRKGSRVEWYVSDSGDVPATSEMVAANLKATWQSLYWNVLAAS